MYYERAKDCISAITILDGKLDNYDVIHMLYSIGYISLINCLTVKYLGEKAKDHRDLCLVKELKSIFPDLNHFERQLHEINELKNSSEYGDRHFRKPVDIKRLIRFLDFVECKIN
ncbi:MAG: hypothetical protein ACOCUR_02415 [Nanoarchaeota archaeon]